MLYNLSVSYPAGWREVVWEQYNYLSSWEPNHMNLLQSSIYRITSLKCFSPAINRFFLASRKTAVKCVLHVCMLLTMFLSMYHCSYETVLPLLWEAFLCKPPLNHFLSLKSVYPYPWNGASVSSSSYLWLNTNTITALDYIVAYSYLLGIVIT